LGVKVSNESIARILLGVVVRVRNRELSLAQLEASVDASVGAFEGIPRHVTDRLRALPAEAHEQDMSPEETELLGIQRSDEALQELEAILGAIADAQPAVPLDVPAAAARRQGRE
jgi:hypothetical protein